MTTPQPIDWAVARSEKWRRHLDGLEVMLAPLDAPLIAALDLHAPMRVADIGCGSGATTVALLESAPAGTVAEGFDLSPALVDVARRRPHAAGLTTVFEVADMSTQAPSGPPFDRLMSRLGVMFFADPAAAFANLRRWIAPNGRFAFAVWGPVEDNVWMAHTQAAVASAVAMPPADPAAPGAFRYENAAPLVSLLAAAGYADIVVRDWRGTLPIGNRRGPAEAARFALAAFSSFDELLSRAGARAQERALDELTSRLTAYERAGRTLMPARVHIVTGAAAPSAGEDRT